MKTPSPSVMRRLFSATLALLIAFEAGAQTPATHSPPAPSSGEDTRLRQMEAIYVQQLRSLHVPLLGKYVTELQRLAAQAADPAPYQREITRIQDIISSGGVVDLADAARMLKAPAEPPAKSGAPPLPRLRRGALSLTPGLAAKIQPLPDSSAEAAAIGVIEWRIESLAAGAYEVILHYACPALDSVLPVTLTLGKQSLATRLDSGKTTPDAATYSILRLGRLDLPAEARGGILSLSAGEPARLHLKQLILTPVKTTD